MTDLHERIKAAVEQRLATARAAGSKAWAVWTIEEEDWPTRIRVVVTGEPGVTVALDESGLLNLPNALHVAANDPATIIRHCERDLRVLQRHAPFQDTRWVGPGTIVDRRYGVDLISEDGWWTEPLCDSCEKWTNAGGSHYEWPCPEILDLAAAYGIAAQPDHNGG